VHKGSIYKYHIISNNNNYTVSKSDPFAFHCETPPKTASIVWDLDYEWNDSKWMKRRQKHNGLASPISIYEVHLGSWRRVPEEKNRFLSYREMAPLLADYVKEMGFTHVEFLPLMEHPFYGSWGYQTTGYFAPTSRYGTPQDLMYLIDTLHQKGIGVILDWVPSHFSQDEHGLVYFDGTHLYEHADPKKGYHPDWRSYIFNYGRNEVQDFLLSSALFWLDRYHIDGIRVDAVASMLYLDYSRKKGEWIPNKFGGRENLEAISFIRKFNEIIYKQFPDVNTIAEESTAWPMVSRPTSAGGLGFGMKWNMGWMHDTLVYMSEDPINRKYHHNQLTFSMWYAFYENFILPLSHDEVVYGKCSLLRKMPGDDWRRFANLRLLFGYMYGWPGKKLLFMGGEFGQYDEWNHDKSLDWDLLKIPFNKEMQLWMKDLLRLYKNEQILHKLDFEKTGFEWVDFGDWQNSVLSFLRKWKRATDIILVVLNFTPVPRPGYRLGVPQDGIWKEILNSDSTLYGGSGICNIGPLEAEAIPSHGRPYSLKITLPPLGAAFIKCQAPQKIVPEKQKPEEQKDEEQKTE
ncbi:MAG: 1,4-alpha-glucan branching protein GlgB, partial [Candidatus Omnitrophica bacterium]|nr:1,4-alpha-glucan branching protein GlgB [Candidatus Omnitrophota bacterium]